MLVTSFFVFCFFVVDVGLTAPQDPDLRKSGVREFQKTKLLICARGFEFPRGFSVFCMDPSNNVSHDSSEVFPLLVF